jgi:hypothetical protein
LVRILKPLKRNIGHIWSSIGFPSWGMIIAEPKPLSSPHQQVLAFPTIIIKGHGYATSPGNKHSWVINYEELKKGESKHYNLEEPDGDMRKLIIQLVFKLCPGYIV